MLFQAVALAALALPSMVHGLWPFEKSIEKRLIGIPLNTQQATQIANNYAKLFTQYSNAYANTVLTPDFQDVTDSVDFLINNGTNCPVPYGSTTFPSRAAFEAGSGTQPDIPFQILNTWVSGSNVIVRWLSAQTPEPVRGIAVISTVFNPVPFQQQFLINHIYSEFNSGSWGVNVGICKVSNTNKNC